MADADQVRPVEFPTHGQSDAFKPWNVPGVAGPSAKESARKFQAKIGELDYPSRSNLAHVVVERAVARMAPQELTVGVGRALVSAVNEALDIMPLPQEQVDDPEASNG